MKFNFLQIKTILTFIGIGVATIAGAQCVSISCPSNVTVNNTTGGCGAVVNYTPPVGTTSCTGLATFNYTGAVQTWTVPAGVTSINVDLSAAGGGLSANASTPSTGLHNPGTGGRLQATLSVTPGQVLNIYVGQKGNNGMNGVPGTGGFNGGGNGDVAFGQYTGGGGGGATDIRIGGTALANRVAVAGGGGGAASNYFAGGDHGGNGGGLSGVIGLSLNGAGDGTGGGGGTQVSGGNGGTFPGWANGQAGSLGLGGSNGSGTSGGGGGGGYYGGGSGSWTGGGGGSGYASPVIATAITHTTGGGGTNNGQLVITYPQTITTTQTAGLASGATFPVGVTTNTYSVTNGTNTTSCSFTVTVVDNEAPVLNCPSNIIVNNSTGTCGAVVNYIAPVGTDNCPGTITTQTAGLASGATFPIGVTTNSFSATDNVGLTTTCSFTVTVVDAEAPAIICPADITANTDAGVCSAVVTYIAPVGTDNCPSAATSYLGGGLSGDVYPTGTSTISYQVVDNVGLTATCSFDITVTDNEDPTILCPANVSTCVPVVNGIAPGTSADNCGVATIAYTTTGATTLSGANDVSGETFSVGTTNVVYTATDAEGNTGTCAFDVVIVAPTNTLAGTSGNTESNIVILNGTTDGLNTDCELIATVTPSGVAPVAGNVNFSVTIDPTVNDFNGQIYLQRHFDIEPATTPSTATATVTLYVLQSEFDAFNAASDPGDLLLPTGGIDNGGVRITQYHGTGTAPGNYTGSAVAIQPLVSWDAANNWWELTFPVTGFSGFYIHTGYTNNPLAIHLTGITANNIGTTNKIDWATATEERNDKFGLEHSVDGINFKEIYNTPAKGSAAQYAYLHEGPATGKNFYRLKLYNGTEKFTYSNVVTATVNGVNNFTIETYPNPVQNTLTVKVTGTVESNSQVVLTDIAGKVIATQAVTNNTAVFDMANHANGIYFIRYTDKSHSEVLKVNKQ